MINKIENKNKEISNLNSQLNTYKIRQNEYDKKEKNLKKEIEENTMLAIFKFKEKLCDEIKNIKGNLSKDKFIEIINKEAE